MGWEFDGNRPIYAQMAEILKSHIISGRYSPGERLPTVRDLAGEAGVNPNTVQRALAELERAGLVHTMRTQGRFVTLSEDTLVNARMETARELTHTYLNQMNDLGFSRADAAALIQAMEENENE